MSAKAYLYDGTKKLRLKEAATDASAFKAQKAELKERTEENLRKAAVLQEKLYAAGQEGLIFAMQARDAAGKDSLIKHVFSALNPQALEVHAFKAPNSIELSHDYLWRIEQAIPPRCKIGVLNRSHYEDVLVVECLALGMEQFKETIVSLLKGVLKEDGISIRGVYERSDANERKKEGLPKVKGFIGETFDTEVEITENGVHYLVDVVNGQKTGFFLDQKYNRLAMQRICKGKRVLDCFTHMGTFALNAGIAGASDVTGLDISEYAVQQANANAVRNHLEDTVHFRCANVLDELPKLAEAGEKYDVVILDPPAFTKSREATKNAIKGYREINMKGLKLVKDGGYLATCSCSHFMTQELLAKTVKEAAKAAHKRLRQVEFRTQAPDHPILWANSANVPESYYLKFFIFQVVDEK